MKIAILDQSEEWYGYNKTEHKPVFVTGLIKWTHGSILNNYIKSYDTL